MNLLEKVVTLVLAVFCLFIFPIVNTANQSDEITRSIVYNSTSEFVESVREQGKITQDMYMDFITSLDNTGYLYDIEFKRSHDTEVPVFETSLDGRSQVVVGSESVTYVIYTDDILRELYATDGLYVFDKGDTFTVSVKSRGETISQQTNRLVFDFIDNAHVISVRYGGTIRDENY